MPFNSHCTLTQQACQTNDTTVVLLLLLDMRNQFYRLKNGNFYSAYNQILRTEALHFLLYFNMGVLGFLQCSPPTCVFNIIWGTQQRGEVDLNARTHFRRKGGVLLRGTDNSLLITTYKRCEHMAFHCVSVVNI